MCNNSRDELYLQIDLRVFLASPSAAANQRREIMKIILCDWLQPTARQNVNEFGLKNINNIFSRYISLRNDDFVVEYQVQGDYFLVQYDERTELYFLPPPTPEKIEIPDCADFLSPFEKSSEYFQTWYLDVNNDILLTRISIRGVTLDWRRRYPSFYLTFQVKI